MQDTPDISKIISLIMQNPSLIEQISALAKQGNDTAEDEASNEISVSETSTVPDKEKQTVSASTDSKSNHRHELLGALKPYLSESRRSAIDSMISISDILGMMRKQ